MVGIRARRSPSLGILPVQVVSVTSDAAEVGDCSSMPTGDAALPDCQHCHSYSVVIFFITTKQELH